MSARVARRVLVAGLGLVLGGCAETAPVPKAPLLESAEDWSFDTWFDVPGDAGSVEVLFIRSHSGGFDVAYDDLTTYTGAGQPGFVLGSMRDGRFSYRYPGQSFCRGGAAVVSEDETRVQCEPDGWTARVSASGAIEKLPAGKLVAPAIPGIERCATLRPPPDADGRRPPIEPGNAHVRETGEGTDRRVHAVLLAVDPAVSQAGTLRYVTCALATGEERVVELSTTALSAAITLDPRGEPAIAFVEQLEGRGRLALARRHASTVLHDVDTRLASSREACDRLRVRWDGPRSPPFTKLTPDEALCSVMMADAEAAAQAKQATQRDCDAGQARACWLAGSLRSELMRGVAFGWEVKGTTVSHTMNKRWLPSGPDRERDPSAFDFFERGCALGDIDSCTRVLAEDPAKWASSPRANAQCNAGSGFACELLKAFR